VAETVAWGEVLRIDPELNRKTVQMGRAANVAFEKIALIRAILVRMA